MAVRASGAPRSPQAIPGEPGLWLFMLADMTVFGLFFIITLVVRANDHAAFARSSAELHQGLGTVNTMVLLGGSALVALALRAARAGAAALATRLVSAAILCGAVFVMVKGIEWADLLKAGHAPSSGAFYQLYFMLTGLHLLHVVAGMGALLAVRARLRRPVGTTTTDTQIIEGGASYWHMVDLLWLVLFPLLYLIG